jgi:hypothetical protein
VGVLLDEVDPFIILVNCGSEVTMLISKEVVTESKGREGGERVILKDLIGRQLFLTALFEIV